MKLDFDVYIKIAQEIYNNKKYRQFRKLSHSANSEQKDKLLNYVGNS